MNRLGAEKIYYHSEKLIEIKEKGDTYPVHMTLGVVDYCNHKCIFCNTEFATSDNRRHNSIDKDTLVRFLRDAYRHGLKAITICGSGEPLIYKDIIPLLYEIHSIGIDIGIFTNGYMLNEDIRKAILDTCTFVRCSINASNQIEHETVHRVKNQFECIKNNIASLVKEKKLRNAQLPTIGTQFVFYEENYKSIPMVAKLWREVGVDYCEIKPLIEGEGSSVGQLVFPALDVNEVRNQMEIAKTYECDGYDVYTKYGQYLNSISKEERTYKKCYGQAITANMWSDGNVYLCSNQEHEKDILGNVYESSFEEIWNGEKRKKRISEINLKVCPRGCKCDAINEKIWDYLYPDKLIHSNFI